MNKEQLIKNGKFYNPETATLIAVTTWYVYRQILRTKIYQSAKGTFFEVYEQAESGHDKPPAYPYPFIVLNDGSHVSHGQVLLDEYCLNPKEGGFRDDVKIKEVRIINELTPEDVMKVYEHTAKGGTYAPWHHASKKYRFFKTYEEMFSVSEA